MKGRSAQARRNVGNVEERKKRGFSTTSPPAMKTKGEETHREHVLPGGANRTLLSRKKF